MAQRLLQFLPAPRRVLWVRNGLLQHVLCLCDVVVVQCCSCGFLVFVSASLFWFCFPVCALFFVYFSFLLFFLFLKLFSFFYTRFYSKCFSSFLFLYICFPEATSVSFCRFCFKLIAGRIIHGDSLLKYASS